MGNPRTSPDALVILFDVAHELAEPNRRSRLSEHVLEHPLGDVRFPIEQRFSLAISRPEPPVELQREPAERLQPHVLGFGRNQPAGAQPTDVPSLLQHQHRRSQPRGGDGRDHSGGRATVDDDIELI
jgi:hypothetical protein